MNNTLASKITPRQGEQLKKTRSNAKAQEEVMLVLMTTKKKEKRVTERERELQKTLTKAEDMEGKKTNDKQKTRQDFEKEKEIGGHHHAASIEDTSAPTCT